MQNINALLKLRAYELDKSIKLIAIETGLDNAYISRVFNNKINITKKRNITKLCKVLNIDYNELYKEEKSYMNLFDKYLNSISILDEDLSTYYEDILSLEEKNKSNTFYIYILLAKFIYAVYTDELDTQVDRLANKLLYIERALENRERKIFLIFYIKYLRSLHHHNTIPRVIKEINTIIIEDTTLNIMYYYYLVIYYANIKSINFYQHYNECCDMCIETNNTKRLFNLKMIYSNFLRRSGYIEKSLQLDLNTLHDMEKSNYIFSKPHLLNNIAWTYLLLNRYEESIEYYLRTIKSLEDNDIYFNLAWCYYCTKNKKKALEYIQIGMTSKSRYDYYYLLLEWLEKMINRKYSKRSLKLLLDVLAYHSDAVPKKMKEFVYNQIIDYYKYHKDFALALYYSDELNDIV